jgi:hypothetical protein
MVWDLQVELVGIANLETMKQPEVQAVLGQALTAAEMAVPVAGLWGNLALRVRGELHLTLAVVEEVQP